MLISEILQAYAKINLVLLVGDKISADGFHSLESVFIRSNLSDQILIKLDTDGDGEYFTKTTCNFDQRLDEHLIASKIDSDALKETIEAKSGLIHRTCELLSKELQEQLPTGWRLNIDLRKSIPIEAGLGGGSANAASIINFFARHFNLNIKQMFNIAEKIGFDVGPCLFDGVSYSFFNGTHQTFSLESPVSKKNRVYSLILKPPIGSNTKEAYSALNRKHVEVNAQIHKPQTLKEVDKLVDRLIKTGSQQSEASSLEIKLIHNDFQDSVFKELRELENVLRELNNYIPIISGLSGSGSSIFSLFNEYKLAQNAYNGLSNLKEKGWFLSISQILSI